MKMVNLTVKEYIELRTDKKLGVKDVYKMIKNGDLKAHKGKRNIWFIEYELPDYVSVKDYSKFHHIGVKAVYELIHNNELKAFKDPKMHNGYMIDLREESNNIIAGNDKDIQEVTNDIDSKNTKLLSNIVVSDDQSKNDLVTDNTNSVSPTVSADDNLNNDSEENIVSNEDDYDDCECEDDDQDEDYYDDYECEDDDQDEDDSEENILVNEYVDKKIYTFKQEFYSYLKNIGKDLELWRNLFKHDKIFELRQLLYKGNTMITVCDDNLDLYFLLNDKENEKKVIKIIDYCIDNKKDARKVILATINYFNMYSNTISIGDFSDINIINNLIDSNNDTENDEKYELLYNLNVFLGLHFYYTVDELMNILLKDNDFIFIGFEKECRDKLIEYIKDDKTISLDDISSLTNMLFC